MYIDYEWEPVADQDYPEPGIYQDDVLTYSWDRLIDEEIIVLDENNVIVYANWESEALIGDLVIAPSVTAIEDFGFSDCSELYTVTIPEGVTSIGGGAFMYCSNLTAVNIPKSVTYIGKAVFEDCWSMRNVFMADDHPVYSVDDYGVLYNRDRTELVQVCIPLDGTYCVPDGVTEIQDYAFEYQYNLAHVVLPNSVTRIGTCAFDCCSYMRTINLPECLTELSIGVFAGC